ncbi:hypothetical protein [Actinomadura craniellae]|uniref:hypothetical protein n=1 Tax=Actinomadura craniellae TaxID=2231787 RepID=UPI001314FFAD|nr:hypothetical protein [Actinomadura craniellae]
MEVKDVAAVIQIVVLAGLFYVGIRALLRAERRERARERRIERGDSGPASSA